MTISFETRDKNKRLIGGKRSTIIDYVDANDVSEAYIKAARNKLSIAIDITKEMKNTKRWGGTIDHVSISLDAVVAKPELPSNRGADYIALTVENVDKLYDDLVDVQAYIKAGKLDARSPNGHHLIKWWLSKLQKMLRAGKKEVYEAPAPSTPEPPTPQMRVCLKCGKDFQPSHRKQRHCVNCLP